MNESTQPKHTEKNPPEQSDSTDIHTSCKHNMIVESGKRFLNDII